ncbi:MAG: hypothetical protein H6835_12550 [Planctomycetes bacterium]|nr:hypothetical protein [Planctomycetota bacterium]
MLRLPFVAFAASCAALLGQQPAADAFRVAPLFGSHMVLPAARAVAIHGFGTAGAEVTVEPSWGAPVRGLVRGDGRWSLDVETPANGEHGALRLTCGAAAIALDDVLFGDVWLASGQSNMEMPVGRVNGWNGVTEWEREVAEADWPELRVFTAQKQTANQPATDIAGEWVVCTPETVPYVSATGYFFARELLRAGRRPIGLVVSSWGGTRVQAWTSAHGLAPFEQYAGELASVRLDTDEALLEARRDAYWDAIAAAIPNATPVDVQLPEKWSQSGLGEFDGAVDYRRTIALPATLRGHDLWLELGAIDDMDAVTWNGAEVGGMKRDGAWNTPRRYKVPAARTGDEQVELCVCVVDTGGEGGFGGDAGSMKLSRCDGQGEAVPLAGTWQRYLRAGDKGLPKWVRAGASPNRVTVLWNGMIEPLLPFPFRGAIWYQGEANRGEADVYAKVFPAMIRDWRRAMGQPELPFYFVQIAPFDYGKEGNGLTAELREAQAAALALPHTGMAVTLDCGDARDIHPTLKQPVGQRLAYAALADCYGERRPACGPSARDAVRDGAALRVRFAPGHGGLKLEHGRDGFVIAGADGVFVAAEVRIDGDELVLSAASVAAPVQVRYAWAPVPKWSLVGGTGIPAAPFRLTAR